MYYENNMKMEYYLKKCYADVQMRGCADERMCRWIYK